MILLASLNQQSSHGSGSRECDDAVVQFVHHRAGEAAHLFEAKLRAGAFVSRDAGLADDCEHSGDAEKQREHRGGNTNGVGGEQTSERDIARNAGGRELAGR